VGSQAIQAEVLGIASLIAILVFVGSFALSMGPIVWVVLSEMFPNKARSLCMSIAVGAQWLFNGVVMPYYIFAIFCAIAFIFVWRFLPETKGKPLEEIEHVWRKKN